MKRGQGRRRGSGLSSRRYKVVSGLGKLREKPFGVAGLCFVPIAFECLLNFWTEVSRGKLNQCLEFGVWLEAGGQPLRSHQSADRWCLYAALRWMRRGYGIGGEETKPWGRCGDPQADGDVGSGSGERNRGVFPPAGRWDGFAWSRCY